MLLLLLLLSVVGGLCGRGEGGSAEVGCRGCRGVRIQIPFEKGNERGKGERESVCVCVLEIELHGW